MTATTLTKRTGSGAAPARTSPADLADLATVDVWHPDRPNAAGLLGISKDLSYAMARTGDLPTIKLGRRLLVPVGKLLAMLDA